MVWDANIFTMKSSGEKDSQSNHIPLSWWQTPLLKTGESGTRATEGQGAELQDSKLPLVLLLRLPSLMSQWSDKEELVEPAEEAKERAGPGTSPRSLPVGGELFYHQVPRLTPRVPRWLLSFRPGLTEPEGNYRNKGKWPEGKPAMGHPWNHDV